MNKKKIAVLTAGLLASVLVATFLLAYYDPTHNFRLLLTSKQLSDSEIALKGSLGEFAIQ